MTFTPEPITTGIGLFIGVLDVTGALNGVYRYADKIEYSIKFPLGGNGGKIPGVYLN